MKRRPAFDGTHQKRALRGLLSWSERSLRTRSGKTLKDLADELSVSPATLARYLSGTTPLSSAQFAPFAAAFDTTEAELVAACFPTPADDDREDEDDDPGWDFRAELARAVPHDPDQARVVAAQFGDEPRSMQRIIAEALALANGSVMTSGSEDRPRSRKRAS